MSVVVNGMEATVLSCDGASGMDSVDYVEFFTCELDREVSGIDEVCPDDTEISVWGG